MIVLFLAVGQGFERWHSLPLGNRTTADKICESARAWAAAFSLVWFGQTINYLLRCELRVMALFAIEVGVGAALP